MLVYIYKHVYFLVHKFGNTLHTHCFVDALATGNLRKSCFRTQIYDGALRGVSLWPGPIFRNYLAIIAKKYGKKIWECRFPSIAHCIHNHRKPNWISVWYHAPKHASFVNLASKPLQEEGRSSVCVLYVVNITTRMHQHSRAERERSRQEGEGRRPCKKGTRAVHISTCLSGSDGSGPQPPFPDTPIPPRSLPAHSAGRTQALHPPNVAGRLRTGCSSPRSLLF